ncbi:MAG: alpha-glucosidase/alpha-galactosidase [Bacillales bacterium]|jgi:alpha-galactosidase|nr:alpha-glucosidase/alpha-galactosidase [Bacillales bacterium]
MKKKLVFIGAGGIEFTRRLLTDILSVRELRDFEITFMDINEKNLQMVTQLCQRDIDSNGLNIKIQATLDRREALKGADYIVNAVRIGGLEAFETDISIPLKYGIDQCVGDTLCAGGIMYGQRTISFVLDLCKDIREVSHKSVLMLNYSNPNAMVTWACNKYGKVNTIGLCHGVQHGERLIADALDIPHHELDFVCAGINHVTWYLSVKHHGQELGGDYLYNKLLNHPKYSKEEKVRIDMFEKFGYFCTESNGHLSEYVPWYRKRLDEIKDWIDLSYWIHGETGGYLRFCTENRNWFEVDFPNWMKEAPYSYDGKEVSVEHGAHIIECLETNKIYRGDFNVVNHNCITNLAPDAIVEVPCYVDRNGIQVAQIGDIPLGPAAVCESNINVQRLAVEAAIKGDRKLLIQAMMLDPLTGAVLNTKEISQMTDEMLVAGEDYLPQYQGVIKEAKQRLINAKADGTYIHVNEGYNGSNRLKVKTIEEQAQDVIKANKMARGAGAIENN